MALKFLFLISIVITFIKIVSPTNYLIVNTTTGPVRGILSKWKSLQYYSYLGIPYAESPSGALRFMPPVPKKPWTHILEATKEGPACPQGNEKFKREDMSEDCLSLNIHVPKNERDKSLPVLVFIHGGAFRLLSAGTSSLYGPQLLLQRGVVYVALNFRLGALGFLSLDIEEASGNAALKDIILALKWINENIDRFGGDRKKITIGGHSSGAALIHYLLLSKKSTNLFQQVILISGSAVNPRSVTRHAKNNAITLAKELRLPTDDIRNLLTKLKELNVFDIIDAEINLAKYDDVVLRPFSMFTPTIEIESSHAVITSEPIKLHIVHNIPILTGFNYKEGIYLIPKIKNNQDKLKKLKDNMELSIPSDIEYPLGSEISKGLTESISQYYFHRNLSNFTLTNIIDLISDSQYIYSTDKWIKRYKEANNSNVLYYYVFNFDGDLNWSKINYNISFPGTAHADELGYMFVTKITEPLLNYVDFRSGSVMDILTTLFSNFIKFGDPTPEQFDRGFKWPDYGKNKSLLFINENPIVRTLSSPLLDRLNFWYDVYDRYYRYVEDGGKLEEKCIP